MKTVPSALQTHLEGSSVTVATLVKLTRTDGEVFGFTDHDLPLTLDGVTYSALSAVEPSQIATSAGLNVDNLNIEGALDSAAITENDIELGLWDFATFEVRMCNWADLSQGTVILRAGELGRVQRRGAGYIAEMLGLMVRLQRTIGRALLPTCDVKRLGDARCGVNLASFTHTATVTAVASRTQFTCGGDIASQAAAYFRRGVVTFNDGALAGLSFNVAEHTGSGVLLLDLDAPLDIVVGVSVTAVRGCDRTAPTCRTTFNNIVNFRGFPHVPGRDKLVGEAVQ